MKTTKLNSITLVLFLGLSTFVVGALKANADATLCHRYTFDDENVSDYQGVIDGTEVGSPAYVTSAYLGGMVIELNGSNQHVKFASIPFGSDFSIAAWVNVADNPAGPGFTNANGTVRQEISMLMANCLPGDERNGFQLFVNNQWAEDSDGVVTFATGDGTHGEEARCNSVRLATDEWHHIAVVVDAEWYARLYIDAVPVVTDGLVQLDFETEAAWAIGANSSDDTGNAFKGQIDDVRIYSGFLTEGQIAALTTRPIPPANTLVHRYTFEGSNANDCVGTLDGLTDFPDNVTYEFDTSVSNIVALFNGTNAAIVFEETDFGAVFSVAAWVKVTNSPVDLVAYPGHTNANGTARQRICTIMANQDAGNAEDGFGLFVNNDWDPNYDGVLTLATGNGLDAGNIYTPGGLLTESSWHHVAFVANRLDSLAHLYVDGSRLVSHGVIRNDFENSYYWKMGSFLNQYCFFNGRMDDVRIYTGILSAGQVSDMYESEAPPISYYHRYTFMDDNANDSEGTLNGTPLNNPAYAEGPLPDLDSKAIVLNGNNQYVHFPATDFGCQYSIAAWVDVADNPAGPSFTNANGSVRQKTCMLMANCLAGGARNGFQMLINNEWNEDCDGVFQLLTGDGVSGVAAANSSVIITNDEWHHVAAVVDVDTLRVHMYIDGETVVSNGQLCAGFQHVSSWSLGANDSDTANAFKGKIADVRIYSMLLSDKDVKDIYENIPEPAGAIGLFAAILCSGSMFRRSQGKCLRKQ